MDQGLTHGSVHELLDHFNHIFQISGFFVVVVLFLYVDLIFFFEEYSSFAILY